MDAFSGDRQRAEHLSSRSGDWLSPAEEPLLPPKEPSLPSEEPSSPAEEPSSPAGERWSPAGGRIQQPDGSRAAYGTFRSSIVPLS